MKEGCFHEIYLETNLDVCEQRDPKGLYKKARSGEIAEFTGVTAPYEAPKSPEVKLNTATLSVEECIKELLRYIEGAFK